MKTIDLFSDLPEENKQRALIYARVAIAIRKKRKELAMSQRELADFLGISQPMVSQLESGDYNISVAKLNGILRKLSLDLNIVPTEIKKSPPIYVTFTSSSLASYSFAR